MKKTLIFLLWLSVFSACHSNRDESRLILNNPTSANYCAISDRVVSINYIALQNENDIVGVIDKVLMDEEYIFVGDYKSHKIFIYTKNGDSVGVIHRYGRGPGEYAEIRDFAIDDRNVYVLDNFTDKLLVYNRNDLSFQKEIKLPFNAWDFEVLGNGGFIFAYAPMPGHAHISSSLRFRLIVTDADLKITQSMFSYKTSECDALAFKNYLCSYDNYILYSSFLRDGYSIISKDDGTLIKSISIDLPYSVPSSERGNIDFLDREKCSYQYDVPIMCGELLAFKFSICGLGYDCFLEGNTNTFLVNSVDAKVNVYGIVGSYKNCFISYWGNSQIYDLLVSNGFPKATTDVEKLIKSDNAYLVLYNMK